MIKIWYSNKEFFKRALWVNTDQDNFYLWSDRPTIKYLTDTHVCVHKMNNDEHKKLFESVKESITTFTTNFWKSCSESLTAILTILCLITLEIRVNNSN